MDLCGYLPVSGSAVRANGDMVPHSALPYRRGQGVCDVTYRLNRVYVPWGSGGVGLEAVSIGPKGRIA